MKLKLGVGAAQHRGGILASLPAAPGAIPAFFTIFLWSFYVLLGFIDGDA